MRVTEIKTSGLENIKIDLINGTYSVGVKDFGTGQGRQLKESTFRYKGGKTFANETPYTDIWKFDLNTEDFDKR